MKRVFHAVVLGMIGVALAVAGVALADESTNGVVVSMADNKLVIRTDTGDEQTYEMNAATQQPTNVRVGDRVMVMFKDDLGRDLVTQITMNTGTLGTRGTMGTTGAPAYGTGNTAGTAYGNTDAAYDTASGSNLPRTASPLPMIALAGLASLGSALGLRRLRRQS